MSGDITSICYQWVAARKQLSLALDAYKAACDSLTGLGIQAGAALETIQPEILVSIEADLTILPQEVDRISQTMNLLKKLRNGSTKLVPINRLPSELLASVFTTAVHSSRLNPPPRKLQGGRIDLANVISSVSAYWRHVSLSTPIIWSDITLTRMGGLNHAALWLERSCSRPLHLSSQHKEYDGCGSDLAELVGRHGSRFRSLLLKVDSDIGAKIWHNACAQHADSSAKLESLAIFADNPLARDEFKQLKLPPKRQMDRYLKSVHTLHVRHRFFDDWNSTVFHGLTTLSLGWLHPQANPSGWALLNVLRASPKLRSLELSSLNVGALPQSYIIPVELKELEVVRLFALSSWFSQWLLKSIVPHQDGLTLTLSEIEGYEHHSIGFNLPFSIPDGVKALHISFNHLSKWRVNLSGLIRSQTRLETLALQRIDIVMADSATDPGKRSDSKLAALDLASCKLANASGFAPLLARHSIRRLRLSECEGCPSTDELLKSLPALDISKKPGDFLTMYSPFD